MNVLEKKKYFILRLLGKQPLVTDGALALAPSAAVIMFGNTEKCHAGRVNSGCTQLSLFK